MIPNSINWSDLPDTQTHNRNFREKIERNMEVWQENLDIFHREQEEKFNKIEKLVIDLLWKEAAARNDEALKQYLHQQ